MLNNVIDHSESATMQVRVRRAPQRIELEIFDRGIGIFKKIRRDCELESDRDAILQLTKGKFTTDPERHTGEGIFFTSRMFDSFAILSGDLYLSHHRDQRAWLLDKRSGKEPHGTSVFMEIDPNSTHTTQEVFDFYASERDDSGFNRTTVALEFAASDREPLISRSQARRVVANLERFKEVVLDFNRVESIGPAFADEIFRVFAHRHPELKLIPINTNEAVERMILKALAESSSE
jgi:hypothetical protein